MKNLSELIKKCTEKSPDFILQQTRTAHGLELLGEENWMATLPHYREDGIKGLPATTPEQAVKNLLEALNNL